MSGDRSKASASISVSIEAHERIRAAAAERGLSVQYLATRAVEDYLDRLIPVAELVLVRPAVAAPRRSDSAEQEARL